MRISDWVQTCALPIYTGLRGAACSKPLRSQRRDDAGQRIAHASGTHARIAVWTYGHIWIAADQAAGSLENHNRGIAALDRLQRGESIALNLGRGTTEQSRRFTGMRGQNRVRKSKDRKSTRLNSSH